MQTADASIFVVDDDHGSRGALSLLLASYGWAVRAFGSAEECLAAITPETECVVSDLQMPGLNGAELIERLGSRATDVPVVIVTGSLPNQAIVAKARKAGAAAIVFKPGVDGELHLAVARAADQRSILRMHALRVTAEDPVMRRH